MPDHATIHPHSTLALARELIARRHNDYDQLVAPRILRGKEMNAADYIELLGKRANLLVFQGDPLAPTGQLESVWLQGREVPQQP